MASVNPKIDKAVHVLETMCHDKKARAEYLSREMALHDEASAMLGSREEGIEIGREKGRIEGRAEIIAKMRKKGMSDEMIDEILNS